MARRDRPRQLHNEIKKAASVVLTSIITLVVGFLISDISHEWRENFKKGIIQFKIDNQLSQHISAVFESIDENVLRIYDINDSLKYYFEPGEYKYSLFIGQYLLKESSVRIEPRRIETIRIDKLPLKTFHFTINIDKEIYGPGDTILTTLFSTRDTWIYLFHYDGSNFQRLNQSAIFLTAFDPVMLDRITANRYPSEDNIVGIALLDNKNELLDRALSSISHNKKSEYSDSDNPWKSAWVSFTVK